jgi:hypothetical protein
MAVWRQGGQDEGAEPSAKQTPRDESRCCRSRSFRLHASRRYCTCSRTCCRSAGRAGASSGRASPACSGGRRGSTPPTRQSCLPCPHSRPGRRRECVGCVVEPDGCPQGEAPPQPRGSRRPSSSSWTVVYPTPDTGRELLDIDSLSANPWAHRATRGAPDLIQRTAHRGSETRDGSIPAGVSLRWVLRGNISGSKGQQSRKRPACRLFRTGGTAG